MSETEHKAKLDEFISQDLIRVGLKAASRDEAVCELAALLQKHGYVKESYAQAALDREKEFPTGLPTMDVQVAIPHTDVEHCLKPGMAVGVLAQPVEFTEMATLDRFVQAEIIFLLSITVPEDQVKWLARLVDLFQTPGVLLQLKDSPDARACRQLLLEKLRKEEP
ncbi:MAG: PTS sugar transporter subunit IIA [Anaerolineae bacterium]|nr:PTS sugar transporter subunit IIA [Anaerolineae bacterium]